MLNFYDMLKNEDPEITALISSEVKHSKELDIELEEMYMLIGEYIAMSLRICFKKYLIVNGFIQI